MGCIYMYTNKINGKKYIGQTIGSLKHRHYQHLHQKDTYIDRALSKYGEQNFELTILEDNINDINTLNEREIYYINKYDTFNNGYNLTKGGLGSTKFSDVDGKTIIELLQNTNLSIKDISKKTKYSISIIHDINRGHVYYQSNLNYPIRKHRYNQKYFQKDVDKVLDLLKNTEISMSEIAKITNTTFAFVCDVNRGKVKCDYHNYDIPIRKYKYQKSDMTLELALKIVQYLKQDLSAEQIANKLDIPTYAVGQINRGKMAICKNLNETFPIQKRPHRNKETAQQTCATLTKENVLNIVKLILTTSLTFEEIARRYNVTKATIDRINRKQTWKNILTEYEAPIRTNPKNINIVFKE